ncbi:MAG: hypothetical protein DCF25_06175 [Leptolyngbya foveolarum]|uniref:Tetratricopeptide repeat protein n=1 Tax=Leptolyngbya foveolarum TaxID=47253 RepID=A0A2W4WE49_9CYAN|nr:MAG: hypothetical protein DCF25_06175 [Leptolyngbya foveolarum]
MFRIVSTVSSLLAFALASPMIATQPISRQILGVNQQSYQSLKSSMELNLRRQLLIAVCDSVVMQNQLATQLEADLAQSRAAPSQLSFEQGAEGLDVAHFVQKKSLERLIFDPEDGNLPKQVAQWVRQTVLAEGALPQLQVLGIEQMTRQPAITQNHFLRSLEKVDALLPRLNTSLLIWVPWPWLRTIQQSAPTFWDWRNGIFEFVSDPTPVGQESLRLGPALTETSGPAFPISPFEAPISTETSVEAPTRSQNPPAVQQQPVQQTTLKSAPAEEDDLSSLFNEESPPAEPRSKSVGQNKSAELYGEKVETQRTLNLESVSVPPEPAQRSAVRRSLATLGGLTSIVTKGVNADIEDTSAHINRSAESTNNAQKERLTPSASIPPIKTSPPTSPARQSDSYPATAQLADRQPPDSPTVERAEPPQSADEPSNEARSDSHIDIEARNIEAQPIEADALADGRTYRARIEAGERDLAVIEAAIAAYESGLNQLGEASLDWSVGLNDLGTLYWLKAQQVKDPQQSVESMTHSIGLYQEALARLQPNQSELIGQIYSNMGAVYSMLATYQNSVDCLNEAVSAYLQALPTASLDADPAEYATLHNSLGSVYWKLSHYEQVQSHLQKAIAAYSNALSGYRSDTQPLEYAAAQNNLGITYWSLAKHENPVNCLKQAIAAYSDALNYRTPEADPTACAITYNNLALAYWDLSKVRELEQPRRAQAQKNSVTAFEAALNVSRTSGALNNMDSTAIYHCLGDVHSQMAETATSPAEAKQSLGKSLYSYIQSLQGVSEASPTYTGRIGAIVANLRSHYTHLGLEGQQAALSKVPSNLLAQVLAAL